VVVSIGMQQMFIVVCFAGKKLSTRVESMMKVKKALNGTMICVGNTSSNLLPLTVWRLGVCYFALQTFQALDKIYRQNNSTKPLLCAGRFISTKLNLKNKT
jgi:hypothetical protein